MQLFGRSVFEKKKPVELYDFAQHGLLQLAERYGMDAYVTVSEAVSWSGSTPDKKATKKAKPAPEPKKLTPKEIHELGTLNTPKMEINCASGYIDEQLETLKFKLDAMGGKPTTKKHRVRGMTLEEPEGGAAYYGKLELMSMMERLNNRRKFTAFEDDLSQYAYTTTDAIRQVMADNKHLQIERAERMMPDLPKDAIKAMKTYTKVCEDMCGKKPVFYLIKEKKDEKEVQRRRDPILLVQSPYGFFWQILGAWDKEVVFLDEL